MYRPASRTRDIAPFHVMELLTRARALETAGRDISTWRWANLIFRRRSPSSRWQAALPMAGSSTRLPWGCPSCARPSPLYAARYGKAIIPASRIVVTTGASGVPSPWLSPACARTWAPVAPPDPGYPCNRHSRTQFRGQSQGHFRGRGNQFPADGGDGRRSLNDATDGLVVASPANPTGTPGGAGTRRADHGGQTSRRPPDRR